MQAWLPIVLNGRQPVEQDADGATSKAGKLERRGPADRELPQAGYPPGTMVQCRHDMISGHEQAGCMTRVEALK